MDTVSRLEMWGKRSLRRAALPLGAALAGAALMAIVFVAAGRHATTARAGQAGELRAERLTVVAPDGTPRMILGEVTVADLTGTGLLVLGPDGRTPRLAQGVTGDGRSGMVVLDSDGAPRLELATGWDGRDDGSVGVTGRDRQGEVRFALYFDPSGPGGHGPGAVFLRVLDQSGQERAVLATPLDGGVGLFLRDQAGRLRLRVGVPPGGAPEVTLLDESGAVTRQAP